MKAVGITCGIGSMLVGARQAGFEVVGNVEWRKYYHEQDEFGRNTFTENFPGARFTYDLTGMDDRELEKFFGADIALGHPECGNFSQLSGANKGRDKKMLDPADIPLFVDLVAKLKPRFFVMDDLPRSFMAFPMSEYAKRLPDYDLFPEWVSNHGYGNVQKGRKRMFMIGSLRQEKWAFVAGETTPGGTVEDCIADLPTPSRGVNIPNQDPFDHALDCFRALNLGEYRKKSSWGEVQEYFRDKRGGFTLEYPTEDGRIVKRIGFLKGHWAGPSHVLTGGNAILHHLRCEPYTIRERARIQGFPDDFVFYGTILNAEREWNHDTNMHMVKQTGKAMPVQFCRYASQLVADHINGVPRSRESVRVLLPSEFVDAAKQWYCENVGYSDQQRSCDACWMYRRCTIRTRKYQVGEPAVGQRDAFDPGVVPVSKRKKEVVPADETKKRRAVGKARQETEPAAPTQAIETRFRSFGGQKA